MTPAAVVKVGGLATRWAPRTPAAVVEEADEAGVGEDASSCRNGQWLQGKEVDDNTVLEL